MEKGMLWILIPIKIGSFLVLSAIAAVALVLAAKVISGFRVQSNRVAFIAALSIEFVMALLAEAYLWAHFKIGLSRMPVTTSVVMWHAVAFVSACVGVKLCSALLKGFDAPDARRVLLVALVVSVTNYVAKTLVFSVFGLHL